MHATFRVDAVQTGVFVANRQPTPNRQVKLPFEKLFQNLLTTIFSKLLVVLVAQNFQ